MSASVEELLASIDGTLKAMLALAQKRTAKVAGATVASDHDLDGRFGDPELKFTVRDWTGPSFKGSHFSECPPDLLDMVAESLDYFASQSEVKGETTAKGKPIAEFRRADAARARGWAKRMRDGKHAAPTITEPTGEDWAADKEWS